MTPLVETVARIIDPSKWAVLDSYLADMLRKYKGEHIGYDPEPFKDKASMAKAQAAIAAVFDALETPSDASLMGALMNTRSPNDGEMEKGGKVADHIIYCGGVTDERAIRLAAEMVRDWRYLLAKAREEMLNGPK